MTKHLVLALWASALTGCSNEQTPTTESVTRKAPLKAPTPAAADPKPAFGPAELVGTWQGPCFLSPAGDGSFNQLTFSFTEQEWTLDYDGFVDETCSIELLNVRIKGPYTLGSAAAAAEGAREGTFGFASKTVTPKMEAAIGRLVKNCGIQGAVVGTPIDMADGCAALGAYPMRDCPADNDILLLKDGVLSFGQRPEDNNLCSPAKRPTSFAGGVQVTKQP